MYCELTYQVKEYPPDQKNNFVILKPLDKSNLRGWKKVMIVFD